MTPAKRDVAHGVTFRLPVGWSSERRAFNRVALYTLFSPNRYMVTVDFTNRAFEFGMTGPVPKTRSRSKATFRGRGWHQEIVDAAISEVRKDLGEP